MAAIAHDSLVMHEGGATPVVKGGEQQSRLAMTGGIGISGGDWGTDNCGGASG
jgi:hypothetical protein